MQFCFVCFWAHLLKHINPFENNMMRMDAWSYMTVQPDLSQFIRIPSESLAVRYHTKKLKLWLQDGASEIGCHHDCSDRTFLFFGLSLTLASFSFHHSYYQIQQKYSYFYWSTIHFWCIFNCMLAKREPEGKELVSGTDWVLTHTMFPCLPSC